MEPKRIYTTILIKRRVAGEAGPPPMLQHGELAMNEVSDTLYIGTNTPQSSAINDPGFF
jgi:hypothetical protein